MDLGPLHRSISWTTLCDVLHVELWNHLHMQQRTVNINVSMRLQAFSVSTAALFMHRCTLFNSSPVIFLVHYTVYSEGKVYHDSVHIIFLLTYIFVQNVFKCNAMVNSDPSLKLKYQ